MYYLINMAIYKKIQAGIIIQQNTDFRRQQTPTLQSLPHTMRNHPNILCVQEALSTFIKKVSNEN